ncbi:MAG: leucine-rich repeat domain-containing protein [Candidatus Methanomethylophilaceae archaeon]|nr:leucine-rich repeat domain-containing protein [Candidatus Methanomethylophilaceae archaeon]
MERHFRYSDNSFVYYQKADEYGRAMFEKLLFDDEGKPVYEEDLVDAEGKPVQKYDEESDPVLVAVMKDYVGKTQKIAPKMVEVQKYDETSAPIYDETSAPVYKKALDANNNPKYLQAVDKFGTPVYSKLVYEQMTYEDGSLVWAQKVDANGKPMYNEKGMPIYDEPVNGVGGTPVYDYFSPKTAPVEKPVYSHTTVEYSMTDGEGFTAVTTNDAAVAATVPEGAPSDAVWQGNAETGWSLVVPGEGEQVSPVYSRTTTTYNTTQGTDGVAVTSNAADKPTVTYDVAGAEWVAVDGSETVKWELVVTEYKPVYDTKSSPVYVEMKADFTATQVGFPAFGETFEYGLHILANGSYYEFDTDDYRMPVLADEEKNTLDPFRNVEGDILYDVHYALVDIEGTPVKDIEVVFDGDEYDAKKFTWQIKPLNFQKDWVKLDETGISIVVPAGYVNEAKKELAEDYTILDLLGYLNDSQKAGCFDIPAGQYTYDFLPYGSGSEIVFPTGANFKGDAPFVNLAWGWNTGMPLQLHVDTLEVTDSLALEDLKKAVHFYPMDWYSVFQDFTIDDFNITVMNADGEVVIFNDDVVRNILASDWYTITVTGNVANGYYGVLTGTFYIEKESAKTEVTEFTYEDYTTAGRSGVKITGYSGNGGDVIIPDYIGGKKVLAIGDNAFKNNKDITSVVMGKYVRTIGFKAFAGCSNLTSVEFDDDLQVISSYAFFNDKKITKVIFGNGLKAVRENAFSVEFLVGITAQEVAGEPMYGKRMVQSDFEYVPVFANYLVDGKTEYNAQALAGKVFTPTDVKGVLVGTPFDMDFGYDSQIPKGTDVLLEGFGVKVGN